MSDEKTLFELNQLVDMVSQERARFIDHVCAELDRAGHGAVLAARDQALQWQAIVEDTATSQERKRELGFAFTGIMLLLNEWAVREIAKINRKAAENV